MTEHRPPHPLTLDVRWRRYQELAIAEMMPLLSEDGGVCRVVMHPGPHRRLLAWYAAIQSGRPVVLVTDTPDPWLTLWTERCRADEEAYEHLLSDRSEGWPAAAQRLPLLSVVSWHDATRQRPAKLQRGPGVDDKLAPKVLTPWRRAREAGSFVIWDQADRGSPWSQEVMVWLRGDESLHLLVATARPQHSAVGQDEQEEVTTVDVQAASAAAEGDLRAWLERVHWVPLQWESLFSVAEAEAWLTKARAAAQLHVSDEGSPETAALQDFIRGQEAPLWGSITRRVDGLETPLEAHHRVDAAVAKAGVKLTSEALEHQRARALLTASRPSTLLSALPAALLRQVCVFEGERAWLPETTADGLKRALAGLAVGLQGEPSEVEGVYVFTLPHQTESLQAAALAWFNELDAGLLLVDPSAFQQWSWPQVHSWLECGAARSHRLRRNVLSGLLAETSAQGPLTVSHLCAVPPHGERWIAMTRSLSELVEAASHDFSLAADGVFERGAGAWHEHLRGAGAERLWRHQLHQGVATDPRPKAPFVRGKPLEGERVSQLLVTTTPTAAPGRQATELSESWQESWRQARARRGSWRGVSVAVLAVALLLSVVMKAPILGLIGAGLALTGLALSRGAQPPVEEGAERVRRAIRVILRTLPASSKRMRELDVGLVELPGRELVLQVEGDQVRHKLVEGLQGWLQAQAPRESTGLSVSGPAPLSAQEPVEPRLGWVPLPSALGRTPRVQEAFADAWRLEFGPCELLGDRGDDEVDAVLSWPIETAEVREVLR